MIRGEKVILRAREPEDAERSARWMNDPEVRRYMGARFPQSLMQARKQFESAAQPGVMMFSIDTLEGVPIGMCALRMTDETSRDAGLGIMIGEKDYWGEGYGTDSTLALCRFGFEQMNLHRIHLDVYTFNERAIRSYEKCGFRREAVKRDAYYKHGEYLDVLVMAVLAGELAGGAA